MARTIRRLVYIERRLEIHFGSLKVSTLLQDSPQIVMVRSPLHATTKPVPLFRNAIENSSSLVTCAGTYLGSGTTLIACDRSGRIGYGMELEPAYIDVVIKRWEAFTGETAVREERQ